MKLFWLPSNDRVIPPGGGLTQAKVMVVRVHFTPSPVSLCLPCWAGQGGTYVGGPKESGSNPSLVPSRRTHHNSGSVTSSNNVAMSVSQSLPAAAFQTTDTGQAGVSASKRLPGSDCLPKPEPFHTDAASVLQWSWRSFKARIFAPFFPGKMPFLLNDECA